MLHYHDFSLILFWLWEKISCTFFKQMELCERLTIDKKTKCLHAYILLILGHIFDFDILQKNYNHRLVMILKKMQSENNAHDQSNS